MGSAASAQAAHAHMPILDHAAHLPRDGADLTDYESAKAEAVRLRHALTSIRATVASNLAAAQQVQVVYGQPQMVCGAQPIAYCTSQATYSGQQLEQHRPQPVPSQSQNEFHGKRLATQGPSGTSVVGAALAGAAVGAGGVVAVGAGAQAVPAVAQAGQVSASFVMSQAVPAVGSAAHDAARFATSQAVPADGSAAQDAASFVTSRAVSTVGSVAQDAAGFATSQAVPAAGGAAQDAKETVKDIVKSNAIANAANAAGSWVSGSAMPALNDAAGSLVSQGAGAFMSAVESVGGLFS